MTTLTINGQEVTIQGDHEHLLAALRDELGIMSPKDGCSPSGQCGCCAVLVDGRARVACQTSLERSAGCEMLTLEGVSNEERNRMADVFAACGALQCGFCTPGILIRTKSLVDRKGSELTREEASRHLGGHLCRCTGYTKILDAVEALAQGETPEAEVPEGVGSRGIKYEARELALGDRDYIDDLRPEGLLHAALHLSEHARADIVRIDTSAAEAMDGVEAVFTAADVPGELRVGIIHTDWPVFIPEGGRTSYVGDVLAIVVAETRAIARQAAEAVAVTYEVHTPITDPVAAVTNGCEDAVWELDGNVLSRSVYARGDVDAALAASAHTIHEVFQTQRIEHAFLEPESTLAVPHGDGTMHVYSGGQGVWDDRDQMASVLAIDPQQITVELVSNGGAFGGKEDMANQAQTALAAWLLGRPVLCTVSREESLRMHPKRHPIRIEMWAGCDAEGHLTALRARMVGDSGPYASVGMKVLERAAGHASGPYTLPNIDVEAVAARTNNPVCGAFRGFGANQAQFAMEGVMDRLAEAVGIDGWEMRSRNAVAPGAIWGPGQIMDDGSLGARACLEAVKPAWDEARGGRQVGGPGARPQELRSGQRLQGDRQGRGALRRRLPRGRRRGGAPLLDRDGPGDPHRGPAGGGDRAGRERRSGAGGGGHHLRAGRGPDHRQPGHADGRRIGGRCLPGRTGRRVPARRGLLRRVPGGLDQQALRRGGEPHHPLHLRLRRPDGGARRRGRGGEGGGRPRRGQGRQPAAVRGPDRGGGPHGAGLRPHRGLPRR